MSIEESTESLAEALMAKHGVQDEPVPETAAEELPAQEVQADDENSTPAPPATNGTGKKSIDISSYDAFPTLGGSQKASASAVGTSWGPNAKVSKPIAKALAPRPANKATVRSTITDSFTLKLEQRNARSKIIPSEVLSRVQISNSVSIDCSTSKSNRASHFIIKGKPENVHKARRELLRELSFRVIETIQVPASVRAIIIGPKGANLRPITERSGTQIQITRKEDTPTQPIDDDDEVVVDVTIEGDAEGVEIAKKDIFAIVSSRVRNANMKIQGLPSKLYPALAGINGAQVKKLEQARDVKITIPDHFYLVANKLEAPITISGERNAVIETKSLLENLAQTLASTYTSIVKGVPRTSQLFLSPADLFNSTGVVVSPVSSPNELELYGPSQQLGVANAYISDLSKNLLTVALNISKAHSNNVAHSKALAAYFRTSGKLENIEKEESVIISTPSAELLANPTLDNVVLDIVGRDADSVTRARKQIVSLVNDYSPHRVLVVNDIDPFFYSYLYAKSKLASTIKSQYFSDIFVPEDPSVTRDIIFVYQGDPRQEDDDFAPGAEEIKAKLAEANATLNEIRINQKDIVSHVVHIPVENHKFIQGPNGTTLFAILRGGDGDGFVTVQFGNGYPLEDPTAELTPNSVHVRGLSAEVKRIIQEFDQVIEEGRNYEVLSQYTTEFIFPAEHVNKLIGKGGSNLTKIREEFGVKIDVDEAGKGVVKGIKKNADEAKTRILNFGRRLADEVNLKLNVPNEFHATLIGTGGKFVKRLEEKYDVRIKFPRNNDSSEDTGKDKPNNDEVLIRGPSRGVVKAKEELLELLQYEKDHGHTQTITVPARSLPRIIGKQGEFINDIKDTTNTRIDVGHQAENENKDTLIPITITGTKTGVKSAIERVQEVVKDIEDTVTEEITVDPKHHRILIGSNGSAMRDIIAQAGETFNSRLIQIPSAGSNDSQIKVHGKKKVVAKIIKIIQGIIDERDSQVELRVPVAPERHGAIIGPGGAIKKEIETSCKVNIFVPKQGSKTSDGEIDINILVIGKQEGVELAKTKIEKLTADDFKVSLDIPKQYHSLISDHGLFIRKLRTDFNVRVDHARAHFPKDQAIKVPAEAIGEALITDENPENLFKWTVIPDETVTNGASTETIPWRLKGSDSDCQKAKAAIEKTLNNVKKYNSTGFLWLADPTRYRLVIGPQGSRINSIRAKSACSIFVPKSSAKREENVITLRGDEQQLEKAKSLILESIARR